MNRRSFLAVAAASIVELQEHLSPVLAQTAPKLGFGAAEPFSFQRLIDLARSLSGEQYIAPLSPVPKLVNGIDFDVSQHIKFHPSCSLWNGQVLPVRLFHLNKFVGQPVKVYAVKQGTAREVLYSKSCFDYEDEDIQSALPSDLGYSGFRVMDGPGADTDWLAFQGASYFRSSGSSGQYGSSARGVAINTAMPEPEEFPRFSRFWVEEGNPASETIVISALLEGQSVTGAYRFLCRHSHRVVMDVEAHLFSREDISRLGIAPLTSMFWYGENTIGRRPDWRPEIHDCDGLAIWTGRGERIWRPLINPPRVLTNSFVDNNPKGFGLLQRDHDFNNYQDDGAFYNKRPSVWVEPVEPWGEGAVQLVQIPTNQEIDDNIVAYWVPKDPVPKGQALSMKYRLYWSDDEPHPPALARVVATRVGRGGVPGRTLPTDNQWKFVIDYEGGTLDNMETRYDIKPIVTLSRGQIERPYVIKVVGTSRWRSFFDISADGQDPIELRCYLRLRHETLSETWTYEFFPQSAR